MENRESSKCMKVVGIIMGRYMQDSFLPPFSKNKKINNNNTNNSNN